MINQNNILLLGSSGFVGCRVKNIFEKKNIDIFSPKKIELNLANYSQIKRYLIKNKISHIINCAGKVGGILDNSQNQLEYYKVNNEINYNLVTAAHNAGINNFLNLSSSCMYPDHYTTKMKENKLMTGRLEETNLGYSIAKLSAAYYIKLIKEKDGLNYANLIPCNLYGPCDNFHEKNSHLLASIIRKVINAKKNCDTSIEVWGDGKPKREFLFVDDLANFIFLIIKKNYILPPFLNVGYGKDYSVKNFYKIVMKICNYNVKLNYDFTKPNGIKRKLIDSSLAKNKYNFKVSTSLENGIKKTIKYYEDTL